EQIAEQALAPSEIEVTDDALRAIVEEYTREAGVRNLEREIASICRKVAVVVASDQERALEPEAGEAPPGDAPEEGAQPEEAASAAPQLPIVVDAAKARELLGRRRFFTEVSERID